MACCRTHLATARMPCTRSRRFLLFEISLIAEFPSPWPRDAAPEDGVPAMADVAPCQRSQFLGRAFALLAGSARTAEIPIKSVHVELRRKSHRNKANEYHSALRLQILGAVRGGVCSSFLGERGKAAIHEIKAFECWYEAREPGAWGAVGIGLV